MRKKLKNGAEVLHWFTVDEHDAIVLCEWGDEFVTWSVDREGAAYLGHYFKTYKEALRDFFKRAERRHKGDWPDDYTRAGHESDLDA